MNLATTTTLSHLKNRVSIRDGWSGDLDSEFKYDDKEETLLYLYEENSTLFAVIQLKETKIIVAILSVLVHGIWTSWDHLLQLNCYYMDEICDWACDELKELIILAKEYENSNQEFKEFLLSKRPDIWYVLDDTSDNLQKLVDAITDFQKIEKLKISNE